jgi:glycine betaine/proline transport system ATP-binding protein
MQPIAKFQASSAVSLEGAPRVKESASLSELIQLAIDSDAPIVVRDNDIDVGVITRADILQTVIDGAETS